MAGCASLAEHPGFARSQAISVGNVSGSARPEVVVGQGEYDDKQGGKVAILTLSGSRAATTVSRVPLTQDSKGVRSKAEKKDRFGASLTLLDHDRDGHLDLTVGAPSENDGDGAVTTIDGSGTSFTTKGARTLTLADLGFAGADGARFGSTLGR